MARRFDAPLASVVIWAGLLIAFIAVRPVPYSLPFWLLAAAVAAAGGAHMFLSHRESRQSEVEISAWTRKLEQLVDVRDFDDDGHLPEYFDESERCRILAELERMPRGARSLRRAIGRVSPDLVKDDD
jgi:hypothetical protein